MPSQKGLVPNMLGAVFLFLRNVSNLVWFTKLRGLVKVHALPLFGGALSGLLFMFTQDQGVVVVNIGWASNAAVLAAVCNTTAVCLDVSQGPVVVSSLIVGAFSALVFNRLYLAESPNHPWLVKADAYAEDLLSKVPTVEPPKGPEKSTSKQAWKGEA